MQMVLERRALEKLSSFGGPKLALPGSKIGSVSSGGMENLLGLSMGYSPGQLDQWMGRYWPGRITRVPHKAKRVGEPRGSEDGSPLLLLLLRWAEAQGSGVLG